jgi:hypothetical protein
MTHKPDLFLESLTRLVLAMVQNYPKVSEGFTNRQQHKRREKTTVLPPENSSRNVATVELFSKEQRLKKASAKRLLEHCQKEKRFDQERDFLGISAALRKVNSSRDANNCAHGLTEQSSFS